MSRLQTAIVTFHSFKYVQPKKRMCNTGYTHTFQGTHPYYRFTREWSMKTIKYYPQYFRSIIHLSLDLEIIQIRICWGNYSDYNNCGILKLIKNRCRSCVIYLLEECTFRKQVAQSNPQRCRSDSFSSSIFRWLAQRNEDIIQSTSNTRITNTNMSRWWSQNFISKPS